MWYNQPCDNHIVLSTRVRLARNLNGYNFPVLLKNDQCDQVVQKVSDAIVNERTPIAHEFRLFEMNKLSPVDRHVLLEKHLVSPQFVNNDKPCAALVNADESVSIMINEEDHVRIQCISPGFDPVATAKKADDFDTLLEENLDFAFHEEFGYLTSCPTNTGTGMRVSAMLHLPAFAMTGGVSGLLNSAGKVGMTVRGLYGEGTKAVGDYFQISNQITIGATESEIVEKLTSIVSEVEKKENEIRRVIYENGKSQLIDRILRSYGILTNAYMLSADEFMRLLSDVRLGASMGLIKGVSPHVLNELMIKAQPASIVANEARSTDDTERHICRAKLVKQILCLEK